MASERMNDKTFPLSRTVYVINQLGLHARAAAEITKLAEKAASGIWITKSGETVDASSIIDILSLAAVKGSQITITVDNPLDIDILNAIEALVQKGFGEK